MSATILYEDRGPFFRPARPGLCVFAVSAGSHYQYVDRTTIVEAEDGRGIEVQFTASTGSTTVSGIELRRR